jgi:lysophospholipase L1-like esterase
MAAAGTDAATEVSCFATPSRLIVLGDSIAACAGVGGKEGGECGPKKFHAEVDSSYASGLAYENLAVSGAVTTNVADRQLDSVTTGQAGHALVLIYVGGNDLQQLLPQSDSQATNGLNAALPGIREDWAQVFAFFGDELNFPDGATIIMNNQYNPFDDCTAPPYNLSTTKTELLGTYNQELALLAEAHDNVVLTDQHTSYLGHGHHYQVTDCPHYQPDLTPFMQDLIHPNAAGHANLAEQWSAQAAEMYGCE